MDTVIVYSTFDLGEAQLIRSRLETAGFQAEIADESSAANFGITGGGAHLTVPEHQAADARAFIHSEFDKPDESSSKTSSA